MTTRDDRYKHHKIQDSDDEILELIKDESCTS